MVFNKIKDFFNKKDERAEVIETITSSETNPDIHQTDSLEKNKDKIILDVSESEDEAPKKKSLTKELISTLPKIDNVNNSPIKANIDISETQKLKEYNGEAFHFSCTKCGQCCKTPPKVEFSELVKLKDDFIFQTNHTCFISYNKKPLAKEILDFYNGIGHTIVLTDLEAVLFYFIEFTPIVNPSYKSCSKLENNLCSIYDRRPNSCELYPYFKSYEQDQQWRSINFFKKQTEAGVYHCDFSDNSPKIYEANSFLNYETELKFEESIQNIHNFTNHYINFLQKQGGKAYKEQHFKYLVNAVSQKSLFISDTLTPLVVGIINGLITKEEAEDFVNSQIVLIEKEINLSKLNKTKENLHTSRLYDKQKKFFEKALQINMFDIEQYKK